MRRGAAGIGREIAADGAGALGGQKLRIEPVDFGCRFARARERDAGFGRERVGDRIDLADFGHAIERENDLAVQCNLPADQSGIAALRHDRGAGVVGEFQDRRHLFGGLGAQDQRRVARPAVALLVQIGGLHIRIGDGVLFADDRA